MSSAIKTASITNAKKLARRNRGVPITRVMIGKMASAKYQGQRPPGEEMTSLEQKSKTINAIREILEIHAFIQLNENAQWRGG